MQLSLFDDLYALEQEGFSITRPFKPTNDKRFKKLENTYGIVLNGKIVMYVQDNNDGTYNTFGFYFERFNVALTDIVEIVGNKNNWCF